MRSRPSMAASLVVLMTHFLSWEEICLRDASREEAWAVSLWNCATLRSAGSSFAAAQTVAPLLFDYHAFFACFVRCHAASSPVKRPL